MFTVEAHFLSFQLYTVFVRAPLPGHLYPLELGSNLSPHRRNSLAVYIPEIDKGITYLLLYIPGMDKGITYLLLYIPGMDKEIIR